MTSIAHKLLKRLTVAISLALVLMGVAVTGHAKTIHVPGISASAGQPCHHAMSETDALNTPTLLDVCRELCLNKVPDLATTAVLPTLAAPRATTELHYATLPTDACISLTNQIADVGQLPAAPPLRRTQPTLHQRLLI